MTRKQSLQSHNRAIQIRIITGHLHSNPLMTIRYHYRRHILVSYGTFHTQVITLFRIMSTFILQVIITRADITE